MLALKKYKKVLACINITHVNYTEGIRKRDDTKGFGERVCCGRIFNFYKEIKRGEALVKRYC